MTARIAITAHARQRIAERLAPELGAEAEVEVVDAVLDAAWNGRFTRRAPSGLRCGDRRRSEQVRYVSRRCGELRFTAVVSLANPAPPVLITVLTDRMGPAPLPTLADGRVIGVPRSRPLPVAFQPLAA